MGFLKRMASLTVRDVIENAKEKKARKKAEKSVDEVNAKALSKPIGSERVPPLDDSDTFFIQSYNYLQEVIVGIEGASIELRVESPNNCVLPEGWHSIEGYAVVVDGEGKVYGTMSQYRCVRYGYPIGSDMTAYVDERGESAMLVAENKGSDPIYVNINDKSWLRRDEEKFLFGGSIEILTPKKGSAAKGHIVGIFEGKIAFDVSAREKAYKELLPLAGNEVKMIISDRRDSKIDDGKPYYKLSIFV